MYIQFLNSSSAELELMALLGGCYLDSPPERQVAISFLQQMEKITGWRTSEIASGLEEQWNSLDQGYES